MVRPPARLGYRSYMVNSIRPSKGFAVSEWLYCGGIQTRWTGAGRLKTGVYIVHLPKMVFGIRFGNDKHGEKCTVFCQLYDTQHGAP